MNKIIWTLVAALPLVILADYLLQPPDTPAATPKPRQEEPEPAAGNKREQLLEELSDVKKRVAEQDAEIFLEEAQKQAAEARARHLDRDEHLDDPAIRPTGSLRTSAYVCDYKHHYDKLDRALKMNEDEKVDELMEEDCRQTISPVRAEIYVWNPDTKKAMIQTVDGETLWTGTWNVSLD